MTAGAAGPGEGPDRSRPVGAPGVVYASGTGAAGEGLSGVDLPDAGAPGEETRGAGGQADGPPGGDRVPGGAPPRSRGWFGLRPDPPPPAHRWGIGAFVVAEAVFIVLGSLLAGVRQDGGIGLIVLTIAVPTLAAAALALVVTRWRGNGPKIDLGLRFDWDDVGVGVVLGVVGLLVTLPAAAAYVWLVGPDRMSVAVGDVFGGLRTSLPMALLVLAVVALVAPVAEEILFRGLLWGAVAKHVPNPWVVYAVTTVLFAIAHFELVRTPLLVIVALPLGLARVLTGRLWAGVIAHQINNFVAGIPLVLMLTGVVPG